MKLFTDIQINFLLDTFFDHYEFPGSRSIGRTLLETGQCIVAGTDCIYPAGSVGDFISISPAEDTIGCSLYTLDRIKFLNSALYFDEFHKHSEILHKQFMDLQQLLEEKQQKLADLAFLRSQVTGKIKTKDARQKRKQNSL